MKAAIIISDAWPQYYASSPFKNFLDIAPDSHQDFEIIPMNSKVLTSKEFQERIKKFDAVVVDEVFVSHIAAHCIFSGPLLMIDGDPHRHRPDQVLDIQIKYETADYVLTGANVEKTLPQYFYPCQELRRAKSLYYPHSAPGVKPPKCEWDARHSLILLSGSVDPAVYPFRAGVKGVVSLGFQHLVHQDYFNFMALHKAAVTCNSIFEYTVAKYFEIPWCGCLLLARTIPQEEADLLGFKCGSNCVLATEPHQLEPFINNVSWYDHMSAAGHQLIMERHTIYQRLEYLSRLIKKLLAGGFKPGDELPIFASAHLKETV